MTEDSSMVVQLAEEWDDSLQSKEEIEASLLHKYEAAVRRERALAYSYTHQVNVSCLYWMQGNIR